MNSSTATLGKYELRERLGMGGMAEVWKAFDPQLQRYVAIKFVRANLRADPTFATRFVREAQAVASLRHPNIVRLYDFETSVSDGESMAYMVMDYVEGQTLADYIHGSSALRAFPTASEIVHLFIAIAGAIEYAHQHGIVHRDIKPANILLDKLNTARNPMGEPILSDFGIVKMMGSATGTLTSSSVGTPLYISPEQAKGKQGSEQSDMYSFGVTLYEACTGTPLFTGDSPFAIMHQHISAPPPSPALINPALPPDLAEVILRCLAKEPEQRYPSAAALIAALAETLNQPLYDLNTLVAPVDAQSAATNSTKPALSSRPSQSSMQPAPHNPQTPPPSVYDTPPNETGDMAPARLSSPSVVAETPQVLPVLITKTRGPRKGLYPALFALLILVLSGSGIGAFFAFSSHPRTQTTATAAIVGHGFFSSSGRASGPHNQGINDTFQVSLSNIANPSPGKSYYAWLLPDTNQSEVPSIDLGPLSIASGMASLHTTYMDPQHHNLLATFSRVLITEEPTNPSPQSYSLDKHAWRYYAEIPQIPASNDCSSTLNQLSDLCHVRHLLTADPELKQVGLPSGLNYWFLNNVEEIQKWAREAVDHNAAVDIRHKMIDILTMLDGTLCVQQDTLKAAPGTDNTPDDGSLQRIAAIPLLGCDLTPAQPGYLLHIHNHLNAIIQSQGVLADQATLSAQIGTELNTTNALAGQLRADALQLVAMDDAHLTQNSGLALRTEMDTLATRILSGGTDPATGQAQTGVASISDQIQQLATFEIKAYTA